MICWDRHNNTIIGYFSPRQVQWLRNHVGAVRDELQVDVALREVRRFLDAAVRMPLFVSDDLRPPPQEWFPAAAGCLEGLENLGPEFAHRRLADVALVLDSLPDKGGVVVLPGPRHAQAWVWSLGECGIHLARRLGLERQIPNWSAAAERDASRAELTLSGVLAWLSRIIDGLIEMTDLSYHPLPDTDHGDELNDHAAATDPQQQ